MTGKLPESDISTDQFLQNLGECGLTTATDLRPGAASNTAAMAQQLVDDGKLTQYQVDAILARRFDDLVMGNYEILSKLGAGGMGAVFKARHRRMKRVVALKVLSREVAKTESFHQRFQREVETIARLTHPNIVMAFDADEGKAGPFLVMEFVNGRDLASEVATDGPLSVADAVDCILQSARGLEYAHTQGIVHRDIKPANLMRDASGVIKVADLGLARLTGGDSALSGTPGLTQAGGIVGTVDYMPPEQALDSTAIDHRVDIYSLGCTLFFLLTGQPPYSGNSIMALLLKHRDAPVPSLAAARRETPPDLEAIFQRMVAKAPHERQHAMGQVVQALEGLKRTVRLDETRPGGGKPQAGTDTNLAGPTIDLGSGDATAARAATQAGVALSVAGNAPVPADAVRIAGRTLVLAEPSRTQSGIFRRYLQQLGIDKVFAATSGKEALQLARRERAHALLCSMHLSDMTGVELAHAVLADAGCAGVGFVLATSEAESEEAAALPSHPKVVRMTKPFDLARLTQCLAQVIG